jgi:hypothetical protein
MQRYAVVPSSDGLKPIWLVQEIVVIGGDQEKHTAATCSSEDEARLIALALDEYWDRRARNSAGKPGGVTH